MGTARGFTKGDRVRLVRTADPHTRLQPGEQGTVVAIDSLGTVHVDWDSGSSLGMVSGEDEIEPIREGGPSPRCKWETDNGFEPQCDGLGGRHMGWSVCNDVAVGWVLYHDDGYWVGPPEQMPVCQTHWDEAHHAAIVDTLVIDDEGRFAA